MLARILPLRCQMAARKGHCGVGFVVSVPKREGVAGKGLVSDPNSWICAGEAQRGVFEGMHSDRNRERRKWIDVEHPRSHRKGYVRVLVT